MGKLLQLGQYQQIPLACAPDDTTIESEKTKQLTTHDLDSTGVPPLVNIYCNAYDCTHCHGAMCHASSALLEGNPPICRSFRMREPADDDIDFDELDRDERFHNAIKAALNLT